MKIFYLCWVPGGGNPTARHEDYLSASTEAARLAKKTKSEVYILKLEAVARPVVDVYISTVKDLSNET